MDGAEELLGGGSSQVRLVDGVVYRLSRPWTPTVHKVLQFLEEEGFSGAPRVEGVVSPPMASKRLRTLKGRTSRQQV
jgi:hypothetical protein